MHVCIPIQECPFIGAFLRMQLATRGDGLTGQDVTRHMQHIQGLPSQLLPPLAPAASSSNFAAHQTLYPPSTSGSRNQAGPHGSQNTTTQGSAPRQQQADSQGSLMQGESIRDVPPLIEVGNEATWLC
jgi:hypothetical protein